MIVYGPNGGNLRVKARVGSNGIRYGKIYSNNTNDMYLEYYNQGGEHTAADMIIYAQDASGTLTIKCEADCDASTVYCPQNDKKDGTDCLIDCSNADGNYQCQSMNIYTKYGTPRDVKLSFVFISFCLFLHLFFKPLFYWLQNVPTCPFFCFVTKKYKHKQTLLSKCKQYQS